MQQQNTQQQDDVNRQENQQSKLYPLIKKDIQTLIKCSYQEKKVILLVGKKGVGKSLLCSQLGHIISGKQLEFNISDQSGERIVFVQEGVKYVIVDTPGICGRPGEFSAIVQCIQQNYGHINALLFVFNGQVEVLDEDDQAMMGSVLATIGNISVRNIAAIFTRLNNTEGAFLAAKQVNNILKGFNINSIIQFKAEGDNQDDNSFNNNQIPQFHFWGVDCDAEKTLSQFKHLNPEIEKTLKPEMEKRLDRELNSVLEWVLPLPRFELSNQKGAKIYGNVDKWGFDRDEVRRLCNRLKLPGKKSRRHQTIFVLYKSYIENTFSPQLHFSCFQLIHYIMNISDEQYDIEFNTFDNNMLANFAKLLQENQVDNVGDLYTRIKIAKHLSCSELYLKFNKTFKIQSIPDHVLQGLFYDIENRIAFVTGLLQEFNFVIIHRISDGLIQKDYITEDNKQQIEEMFQSCTDGHRYDIIIQSRIKFEGICNIKLRYLCYYSHNYDVITLSHPQELVSFSTHKLKLSNLDKCVHLRNFYSWENNYTIGEIQKLNMLNLVRFYQDTYECESGSLLDELFANNKPQFVNYSPKNNKRNCKMYLQNTQRLRLFVTGDGSRIQVGCLGAGVDELYGKFEQKYVRKHVVYPIVDLCSKEFAAKVIGQESSLRLSQLLLSPDSFAPFDNQFLFIKIVFSNLKKEIKEQKLLQLANDIEIKKRLQAAKEAFEAQKALKAQQSDHESENTLKQQDIASGSISEAVDAFDVVVRSAVDSAGGLRAMLQLYVESHKNDLKTRLIKRLYELYSEDSLQKYNILSAARRLILMSDEDIIAIFGEDVDDSEAIKFLRETKIKSMKDLELYTRLCQFLECRMIHIGFTNNFTMSSVPDSLFRLFFDNIQNRIQMFYGSFFVLTHRVSDGAIFKVDIMEDKQLGENLLQQCADGNLYDVIIITLVDLMGISDVRCRYLNYAKLGNLVKVTLNHPNDVISLSTFCTSVTNVSECKNLVNFVSESVNFTEPEVFTKFKYLKRISSSNDKYCNGNNLNDIFLNSEPEFVHLSLQSDKFVTDIKQNTNSLKYLSVECQNQVQSFNIHSDHTKLLVSNFKGVDEEVEEEMEMEEEVENDVENVVALFTDLLVALAKRKLTRAEKALLASEEPSGSQDSE